MLHTKFQVCSSSGTYFSGTQIWPKSTVNWVLCVYRPSKRFCTLLGFDFRIMKGCFYDVFGLPYRLASLLIRLTHDFVIIFIQLFNKKSHGNAGVASHGSPSVASHGNPNLASHDDHSLASHGNAGLDSYDNPSLTSHGMAAPAFLIMANLTLLVMATPAV